MRVVFLGTDNFGVPTLSSLIQSEAHDLVGVVTGPAKPSGRGRHPRPSPIHVCATVFTPETPVFTPSNLKDPLFHAQFAELKADIAVVVAFRILPPQVFDTPRFGTLNVHPSLLPKYRGPAPLNWALINGDPETGVSIIRISSRVDAGGLLLQEIHPIGPDETAGELAQRLSSAGATLLLRALEGVERDVLRPIPQDAALVTKAPRLCKEDGRINWYLPCMQLHNRARGVTPWPGAFTTVRGQQLKLFRTHPLTERRGNPGELLEIDVKRGELVIGCGAGVLSVSEVQLEGKNRMSVSDFLRGYRLVRGERLGETQ